MEITIISTTDKLVIKDWFLGSQYQVEEIRTDDDNRLLLAADVQALVTAMAGMTMPTQGQTTLTTSQHTIMDPVFNSTWQTAPQGLMSTGGSLPVMSTDLSVSYQLFWQNLESHSPTHQTLFDWESLVPHGPEPGIRTKPMMVNESRGGQAVLSVLSDCHRLISMMAIRDRVELETFNPNANERIYLDRPEFHRHSRAALRIAPFKLYR